MATVASARTSGRPRHAMSYQEQKEQKLEELRQRKRYANSVAEQARCRLEGRVYLKDKTNFDKDRAAKWRKDLPVREGKRLQPKVPVLQSSVPQPLSGGGSTVSRRPEEAPTPRSEGATAEPSVPADQIARSKTVPSATAPDNRPNGGQRAEGTVPATADKVPVQPARESERKQPDSVTEQKGKMQARHRKAALSRSSLAVRSEQVRSLATRSGRPRLPLPASGKAVPGLYRGRVVESKIRSFRSASQPGEQPEAAAGTRSDLVVRPKEPRDKPWSKGVENRRIPGSDANAASRGNARGLATAPRRQKPATTSVLKIKIDFNQAGNGDAAIVATQTISKRSTAPPLKTPRDTSRPPAWSVAKPQGSHNPIKRTTATAEKRRLQPVSKGRPVKGSDMTPVQKKKPAAEPVKSPWATVMEGKKQTETDNEFNQHLSQCVNRIQEGSPSADILQTLEAFTECAPKPKTFAKYWICLMYLEQRKGLAHDVMAVYEQAVRSEAQPTEELRIALADILNTKTPKKPCRGEGEEDGAEADATLPLDSVSERGEVVEEDVGRAGEDQESVPAPDGTVSLSPREQGSPSPGAASEPSLCGSDGEASVGAEPTAALNAEQCTGQWMEPAARHDHPAVEESEEGCQPPAEVDSKENCKILRNIKIEDLKTPIKQMTPSKGKNRGSSVKYSVKATPRRQNAKNPVHRDNCSSDIKELRFLTPVRRSRRIEHGSEKLPSMLQDHDPCISSLNDLEHLAGEATAYAFRVNNALQEFTNISMD
ncbi:cytoskeleton-associated protein 2 isoform X1 [Amblyraja radiata]|uniref:cytoskeleton-associated protein 2 isoform X1 n=1 Tax=Amblyraja radiata TaxID=386614 RepID=UPI001401C076|nr:cytoskeleton-associated protein 2 isoform X1 [Amblyraja radiata]